MDNIYIELDDASDDSLDAIAGAFHLADSYEDPETLDLESCALID